MKKIILLLLSVLIIASCDTDWPSVDGEVADNTSNDIEEVADNTSNDIEEVTANTSNNIYVTRNNYGAVLEASNTVMHGAGQSSGAFELYYDTVPSGSKPLIFMYYRGLRAFSTGSLDGLKSILASYKEQGIYLIPQIGLSMTSGPKDHYEGDVAAGLYDTQIKNLCDEINGLGHPVFLRIGYEFNGLGWNGYEPSTYIPAFQRITDALRTANAEVATVWCAIAGRINKSPYTYDQYYPGNSYVDWWGIDTFAAYQLKSEGTLEFLDAAHIAGKPVMIGESTPRGVGVDDGQTDWNTWFEPYFDLIQNYPGIKAFCYINWNWDDYVHMWSPSWGDARIQANDQVRINYISKINSDLYLHGNTETELRTVLGASDTTPPGQVTALSGSYADGFVSLSWAAATDDAGIIRYEISRAGKVIGFSVSTSFTDSNIKAGSTYAYAVKAVDTGGNTGPASSSQDVSIPFSIDKVFNGDFEDGLTGWAQREYKGGAITVTEETSSPLSGSTSAKIEVTTGTGTNWHCQYGQYFASYSGVSYSLSFTIQADEPTTVYVMLGSMSNNAIPVTTNAVTHTIESSTPIDDFIFMAFMMGNCDGRTIWIDDVSLTESE
ncbi:MAG: hypothetical protein GY874_10740 [Desulfobacteraceae bacterium]|nr:hypothetical protein [Desulfobacteraceae bacterium]